MKGKAFLFLFALIICLSSCSGDAAGKTIRYDIPDVVTNLDPQYATDSTARMILSNISEGLLVQEPDGSLVQGVAKSYSVSPDGLTYTFILREDAGWAGKDNLPVTAHDFVFAFHRIFNDSAPSPYATDFLLIKNAQDVLSGEMPLSKLGISAKDDYTLVITLRQKAPLFPQLLTSTPAMPCSREHFENARGRYGLEKQFVDSNGPFYVERWNDTQISLAKNNRYVSDKEALAGGVQLNIGKEKTSNRLMDGNLDAAILPYEYTEEAKALNLNWEAYDKTTWCIVFNQDTRTWGNPLLRQSLAYGLDYDYFSQRLSKNLTPTSVFVPPAARIGTESFRSFADDVSPLAYDPGNAARLFKMGIEMLDYEAIPATTFYVPETGGHALNMGLVQQSWQKNLSAYVNVKPVSASEIENRFITGDYHMLLMPFSPASQSMDSLFYAFTQSSSQNHTGYRSPRYDLLLEDAREQQTIEKMSEKYVQAERFLLSDAVIIPVYNETTYYAMGENVSGIGIFPFGNILNFKYALKS